MELEVPPMTTTPGPGGTNLGDNGSVPSYAELRRRSDAPLGSSWGVFGEADEVGTINFLTRERVLAAAQTVRRGDVFNLDYPMDAFPGPVRSRPPAKHAIVHLGLDDGRIKVVDRPSTILDDYLDGMFLQASTQIDGLRHHAHPDHGFYGGAPAERMVAGDPTIGVNRWAEHGIVGRGVLIDVAGHLERQGAPLDHDGCQKIGVDLVEETLDAQGSELREGDMVLLRTDWPSHLRKHLDDDHAARRSAGLAQTYEVVEWLWDHQVPLVAADNLAVEATLEGHTSEFGDGFFHARLHDQLIPLLGMALGELWRLDELAADCAGDGVYEFMLISKPLNLIGGVGTPANATAVK